MDKESAFERAFVGIGWAGRMHEATEGSGWLGGWGGQGAHRGEKVERREKMEMRGGDICILGVDTLSA